MPSIPFPLSSSPGRTPQEGAGRLLNCYAEPLGTDVNISKGYAPPKVVWRRTPGLTRFCSPASVSGYRGGLLVASTFYTAWSGKIRSYTSAGVETVVGNATGSSKGFWARNNAATPDVVFVDPDQGAFSVSAGSVINFADADLPAPCDVTFLDGYLIFTIGDGRLFSTGINAVTVNALDFAKAETKADSLLRGIAYGGLFFAFGTQTIEVWTDTANPTGFPLSRSSIIGRGLAGRYAVAGHEDGFTKALIWVAEDNTVVRLNGSTPEKISPPDLDRALASVADKNTLEATVYVSGGHSRWVISCATFTWEFDLASQKWNEKQSYGANRWRATQLQSAFGKWIGGDTLSGNLVYVDDLAYLEDTSPLVMRIESGPVEKFPNRVQVARADFQLAPGTGVATGTDPIQTDPVAQVSWSKNGGQDWSNPLLRKIGPQSVTRDRITVTRAGLSTPFGHRWRIDVSDPVYVSIVQGDQTAAVKAH